MGYVDSTDALVAEMKRANALLTSDNLRLDQLEHSVNELHLRAGRPGSFGGDLSDAGERVSAIEMCKIRHSERAPKADVIKEYTPQSAEIDEALAARRGFRHVIRNGHPNNLDAYVQKSLSAFSFAGTGMLLPPERMSEVLSCLVYPSSLAGLVGSINISGPAAEFLIENPRMGLGAWSCENSCFANNPQVDLNEGLGLLTIKPETLRFVACATRDLIEDASMNFESWLMGKISDGMGATINNTLILGDGVGKPMGIMNPRSGIPICETAASTPAGLVTWQDIVGLKYEIPIQWQDGASFLMNQRVWSQVMTMSDANSRPLFTQLPGSEPGFQFAGSPVNIITQMPDITPGSTPIAFGNWKKAYTIVWRKGVTLQVDPYSANFCVIYKAEARVGGAPTCPNAARLLRVR
jgi:HK97 family phage major capsid protein